jgi:hypothetical protein
MLTCTSCARPRLRSPRRRCRHASRRWPRTRKILGLQCVMLHCCQGLTHRASTRSRCGTPAQGHVCIVLAARCSRPACSPRGSPRWPTVFCTCTSAMEPSGESSVLALLSLQCLCHGPGVAVLSRLRDVLAQPRVEQVDPVRNPVTPQRWPLLMHGLSDQTSCIMRTNSFYPLSFFRHERTTYLQIIN